MSGLQRQADAHVATNMAAHSGTKGLKFYNLSARWGHGIPQWPSAPGINVLTLQFHALDGVYVTPSSKASCTARPTWMRRCM